MEPAAPPLEVALEKDDEQEEEAHDWPVWAEAFLAALSEVPNHTRAAELAGVTRRTTERLRKRDEAFALAVYDAREKALDRLEQVLYQRATIGTPATKTVTRTLADGSVETTVTEERHISTSAGFFYLKRYRPEFRDSFRVETSGPGGGPIRYEVAVIEELAAKARADLDRLSESNGAPA